jgi:hypothetical protein
MSPHQAISLNFKPEQKPVTQAGFNYSITIESGNPIMMPV